MIKTIIVDDEIWVIKLIKNLVNWEELGYTIVGDADNCDDALKLIETEKPQLLVTDIRIPGNDGLYLIRQAKEIVPNINIIVISGYSEFEYAKTALKYGVCSYLLKPVDRDELTETLTDLREKVLNDIAEEIEKEERLKLNCEKRRQQLVYDIKQGCVADDLNLRDINSKYCTGFCGDKYTVLVAQLLYTGKGEEDADIREMLEKRLQENMDVKLIPLCGDVIKASIDEGVLLLLNYGDKNAKRIREGIENTYRILSKEVFSTNDYKLIIGTSSEKKRIGDLKDAYEEALVATKMRIYINNPMVVQYTEMYKKTSRQEIVGAKRLFRVAEICEANEAKKVLEDILMPLEKLDPTDVFYAARLSANILFQAWRPQLELIEEGGVRQETVEKRIDNAVSLEQIVAVLVDTVERVQQIMLDMQKSQPEKITAKVKSYIQKHYSEKLTLESICGSLYLSPQYVCSVFKRQEGTTIVSYITDYRISVAKELLLNGKYHVNDVMLMVGYTDAKYFVKVFKKNTGVTPSEYRKMFI